MNLIIKEGEKVLLQIEKESNRLTDEEVSQIESFDDHEISGFEVEFKDGVKMKDAHDFSNVKIENIAAIIANVKTPKN